jgi:predicted transcriptional regulator
MTKTTERIFMTTTMRCSTTFTARVTPEQKAELAAQAKTMKLTKAELVRRAVSAYLATNAINASTDTSVAEASRV